MKIRNFIVAGLAGGLTDFLLGALFYGLLLSDYFQMSGNENMGMIAFGCFTYGFFVSYLFTHLSNLTTFGAGAKAGLIIGLFWGLIFNTFMWASQAEVNYEHFAADIVVGLVIGAMVGGVVAAVNGMLSRPANS